MNGIKNRLTYVQKYFYYKEEIGDLSAGVEHGGFCD